MIGTARYLDASSKLYTDDIDWELARTQGLTSEEVELLTYFSDIELQTINYLRDLLATKAGEDSEVLAFLTIWNYEEFFHGESFVRLLKECGHGQEKNRIGSVRRTRTLFERMRALGSATVSRIFRQEFPAVHATWGAVQELTTLHAYATLGRLTTNTVLKTLCERIEKQERRHFAWYFNHAREWLSRSPRSQWLTRTLLTRFWLPVGGGVKHPHEVARIIQLLFGRVDSAGIAGDIDAKIGTLPGMEGLALMGPFLQKKANPQILRM